MPWEKEYDYAQAVKVGYTIYLSGQVDHDGQGQNCLNRRYGGSDAPSIYQYQEGPSAVWCDDRQYSR